MAVSKVKKIILCLSKADLLTHLIILLRFPVTPDIVQAYGFDALLAKKYFVVCVPTVYEKLFPRLICCPDHEFFDPFHVDGCVHPLPPPPPPPRPTYLPPPFK